MTGTHPIAQLRDGMTPASRKRADKIAATISAEIDALAALTAKPEPITPAEAEAARKAQALLTATRKRATLRAWDDDPQRQVQQLLAHGRTPYDHPAHPARKRGTNPRDLWGNW